MNYSIYNKNIDKASWYSFVFCVIIQLFMIKRMDILNLLKIYKEISILHKVQYDQTNEFMLIVLIEFYTIIYNW